MIGDAVLDIIFGIINAIISILPTYEFIHGGSFGDLLSMLGYVNEFFPVDSLAESIIMYFSFSALILALKPILKLGHVS